MQWQCVGNTKGRSQYETNWRKEYENLGLKVKLSWVSNAGGGSSNKYVTHQFPVYFSTDKYHCKKYLTNTICKTKETD